MVAAVEVLLIHPHALVGGTSVAAVRRKGGTEHHHAVGDDDFQGGNSKLGNFQKETLGSTACCWFRSCTIQGRRNVPVETCGCCSCYDDCERKGASAVVVVRVRR